MMTKRLARFWKALDQIPHAATDRLEWLRMLEGDWPIVAGYLTETGRVAAAIACPSPGGGGCPRTVVQHPGAIRAVCGNRPATCDTIELSPEDISVLSLDRAKLVTAICSILDIDVDQHDDGAIIHLGRHRVAAGTAVSFVLAIPGPMTDVSAALLSADDGPRALVTPTRQSLPKTLRQVLDARGHLILPLNEITVLDDASGLVGVEPAEHLLAALREKLLAGRRAVARARVWILPPGACWEDLQFELISDEVLNVRHGAETRRLEPDDLGMKSRKNGRPIVAWTLLQVLAKANGRFSWESKGASRRVPKHKQLLTERLQEVFGLSDDPVPWRTAEKAYVTQFRIRDSRPNRALARRGPG